MLLTFSTRDTALLAPFRTDSAVGSPARSPRGSPPPCPPEELSYHLAAEVFRRRFSELLDGLKAGTVSPERLMRALDTAMPWQVHAIGEEVLQGLITHSDPALSAAAAAALVGR